MGENAKRRAYKKIKKNNYRSISTTNQPRFSSRQVNKTRREEGKKNQLVTLTRDRNEA